MNDDGVIKVLEPTGLVLPVTLVRLTKLHNSFACASKKICVGKYQSGFFNKLTNTLIQ